jgi:hypothetical protein
VRFVIFIFSTVEGLYDSGSEHGGGSVIVLNCDVMVFDGKESVWTSPTIFLSPDADEASNG